jgi:hypothetical protein
VKPAEGRKATKALITGTACRIEGGREEKKTRDGLGATMNARPKGNGNEEEGMKLAVVRRMECLDGLER